MHKSKKLKLFSNLKLATLKFNEHNVHKYIFLRPKKWWKEMASSAFRIFVKYLLPSLQL